MPATALQPPMKLTINDKLRTVIALVVPLLALIFGIFVFLSRYAYAEDGHNLILAVYILACFALFFALRKLSIVFIAICLIAMLGSQIYAAQKFNWRQAYIESAISGHPFPLEEMIDHYPTYEEHIFPFLHAPDWVRFNNQCVQPALGDGTNNPACASPAAIQDAYNIDIMAAMSALTAKMQYTARQLQSGQLSKRSQYLQCIADKQCATIPLLPKGVDASKLDPMSKDYLDIREAFWSLVKDKKMSRGTCQLTDICRALIKMGIVNPDAIPF